MKLQVRGTNQTVVSFNNGAEIFFSYETPVAGFAPGVGYFKTRNSFSSTTARHINAYAGKTAQVVEQEWIEALAGSITASASIPAVNP